MTVRMMLGPRHHQQVERIEHLPAKVAGHQDRDQNHQTGAPSRVDETHREQGRGERSQGPNADDIAEDRGDEAPKRQEQHQRHDLMHFDRQPREIKHLRGSPHFGLQQFLGRRQPLDRVGGFRRCSTPVPFTSCSPSPPSRRIGHEVGGHLPGITVGRIKRHPTMSVEAPRPTRGVGDFGLAKFETGDQPRRDIGRPTQSHHGSCTTQCRRLMIRQRIGDVIERLGRFSGFELGCLQIVDAVLKKFLNVFSVGHVTARNLLQNFAHPRTGGVVDIFAAK